jgi:hypothetical protein
MSRANYRANTVRAIAQQSGASPSPHHQAAALTRSAAFARQPSEHLVLGDLTGPIGHEHPRRSAIKHRVAELA